MNKVTIGIPVFNVEQYIEKSLSSALNQNFENIDYIIVDGCSTDNSMKIVDRTILNHPRKNNIRILKQDSNRGPGEDRNLIIKNAETEFLYFLDSDDEMTSNCISVLYNAISTDQTIDFVNAQNSTHNGVEVISVPHRSYCEYIEKRDIFYAYLTKDISGVMWNKLYRLVFLKTHHIKTIHSMISEDVSFQLQELYYASKIVVISDVTYIYYKRNKSSSLTSNVHRYLLRRSDVLLDMYKIVIEKKMGIECKIILLDLILSLVYEFGTLYITREEFFRMYDKVYQGILPNDSLRLFLNRNIPIAFRLRLYALAAMCPSQFMRHYISLILSKIGATKRSLLANKV